MGTILIEALVATIREALSTGALTLAGIGAALALIFGLTR